MLHSIRLKAAAIAAVVLISPCQAAPVPSVQDSFRLGDGAGVLCQVQAESTGPALKTMFDRAYAILCRDAAIPVGHIYALRHTSEDPAARLAAIRATQASCPTPADTVEIANIGKVARSACRLNGADVAYRVYSATKGNTLYLAEGLAGYESALQLGLRTIVSDRHLAGTIAIATTSAGDPAAFARTLAGALDPDKALAEGYRRNNSGSYAEAAEFFDTLAARGAADTPAGRRNLGEYTVNRALQKSNLGAFAEADALFAAADAIPTADPVQLRLRRNFKALHLINQQQLPGARTLLDQPIAVARGAGLTPGGAAEIDADTAEQINDGSPLGRHLGAGEAVSLSVQEKAAILDAQAIALKGTILRLQGDPAGATAALDQSLDALMQVRQGRIVSIIRLRAQTMAELAAAHEAQGNRPGAERLLRDAIDLLSGEYPASPALAAAKARLAGFLGRNGDTTGALALFGEVIRALSDGEGSAMGFSNLLAPYFALLIQQLPQNPTLVNDVFLASETLIRPGLADTQAVLARTLSGGSDEAAGLFRQALDLSRTIERNRVEAARLQVISNRSAAENDQLAATRATIASLEQDQLVLQSRLSQFPRYRAISTRALTLPDLQKALRPGEAYIKTAIIGSQVYLILATVSEATAWQAAIDAPGLERAVDKLRATISTEDAGQLVTYPFDIALAHGLYTDLFGQADERLRGVSHLIFEPDGALLRLPINLLVIDQASVDRYAARATKADGDFDFRGTAWLGRRSPISTAVSARGFRDVRAATPSAAVHQYLGFGANAPISAFTRLTSVRAPSTSGAIDCNWPLSEWNKPIAPSELVTAQARIGRAEALVVTGGAFNDTALKTRGDLNQYRVLHFATHGFVAAPRPECPARPALLTSFGPRPSDGLLSFSEIFDLKLDADLVILSACDTAGKASVTATREAGLTRGGGGALDGLVRAFVGAGGRSVLASHWPAPDDYHATERLIGGLFDAPAGTSVATALQTAQLKLMDEADTSHPYYWSGFAVIGDGAQPVLRAR